MPTIQVNGVRLHYTSVGSGSETIVFSHGYLMNSRMFAAQIDALKDRYRIIAYDHRSHGQSEPVRRPYGIYDLTDDGAALIDELVGGPVHFVGMSTGGYVGLRLMLRRPELLRSVTLIDTGSGGEPPAARRQYDLMLAVVRWLGIRPVLGRALSILMGEAFRTDPTRRADYLSWVASIRALDRKGLYHFGNAIFRRDAVTDQIGTFDKPTLVLVGSEDIATPPHRAEEMAAALAHSELRVIDGAGHTSPVEAPDQVTAALVAFLERQAEPS